jgi:hypothetical protein
MAQARSHIFDLASEMQTLLWQPVLHGHLHVPEIPKTQCAERQLMIVSLLQAAALPVSTLLFYDPLFHL